MAEYIPRVLSRLAGDRRVTARRWIESLCTSLIPKRDHRIHVGSTAGWKKTRDRGDSSHAGRRRNKGEWVARTDTDKAARGQPSTGERRRHADDDAWPRTSIWLSLRIMHRTRPRVAPNAIRITRYWLVRRAVVYATTPYRPRQASSRESVLQQAASVASKRS